MKEWGELIMRSLLRLCGWAAAAYLFTIATVMAQPRGASLNVSDFQSVINGIRALISITVVVAPTLLLGWYTWKNRPKDAIEATALILAWCALAYTLK